MIKDAKVSAIQTDTSYSAVYQDDKGEEHEISFRVEAYENIEQGLPVEVEISLIEVDHKKTAEELENPDLWEQIEKEIVNWLKTP